VRRRNNALIDLEAHLDPRPHRQSLAGDRRLEAIFEAEPPWWSRARLDFQQSGSRQLCDRGSPFGKSDLGLSISAVGGCACHQECNAQPLKKTTYRPIANSGPTKANANDTTTVLNNIGFMLLDIGSDTGAQSAAGYS
jgi:hypothetical protein